MNRTCFGSVERLIVVERVAQTVICHNLREVLVRTTVALILAADGKYMFS